MTINKKNGTKTSNFGTSGRINHDSSAFYDSKLYSDLPKERKINKLKIKYPKPL